MDDAAAQHDAASDITSQPEKLPLDYAGPVAQPPLWQRRISPFWMVVILLIGAFLLFSIIISSGPSGNRARETANRVKCASNMRQLGECLRRYSDDHGGQYPDSLATLYNTEDLTPAMFVCPSSNASPSDAPTTQGVMTDLQAGPGHESYIYAAAHLTAADVTADTVILTEPLADHGGGANVLFGDGHVQFANAIPITPVLAKITSGQQPVQLKLP